MLLCESFHLYGAVFFIFLSAYCMVFNRGLLLKLAKTIKCTMTLRLLENSISNRKCRVSLNEKIIDYTIFQNGLPQGSMLSTMLFNVYMADVTDTVSRKFK